MKTLIIYQSLSGNTKKYAEDIGKAVEATVLPLKKFKVKMVKDYDTIVFGGWVMGGTIQGLNKFLVDYDDMKNKNVIVFSTGMAFPTKEGRAEIINQNLLDMYHIRFYQFRGSFDFQHLKFPYNLVMKNSLRAIKNDPKATADQRYLLELVDKPLEYYDNEKVERMIQVLNQLSFDTAAKNTEAK